MTIASTYSIRAMEIEDYDSVVLLMQGMAGVVLRDVDLTAGMRRYLERNPNTSFVALI